MLLFLSNPPQIPLQIKLLSCYTNCSINDKCRWEILEKNLDFSLPNVSSSVPLVPLQPVFHGWADVWCILGVINFFFCGANTSSALPVLSAALAFPNYLSAFDGVCVGSGFYSWFMASKGKGKWIMCCFQSSFYSM